MRFLLFIIGGFIFLILSPFLFFFRTEIYQLENASDIMPEVRILYYRKLVWDGLHKTEAYQKISSEDMEKMQKIYNKVYYFWSREWR